MSPFLHRLARGVAVGGALLLALAALAAASGARLNTTRSIPLGLYWMSRAPLVKGAYVIFCPPDTDLFREARARGYIAGGFCPGGYGYLMKRVVATSPDVVTIQKDGVWVNGERLPGSAPLRFDPSGRPLPSYPAGRIPLARGELLLMSDLSTTSFDGRYFGPLQKIQIRGVIRPVLCAQDGLALPAKRSLPGQAG